jgi:micrococcal nuclease
MKGRLKYLLLLIAIILSYLAFSWSSITLVNEVLPEISVPEYALEEDSFLVTEVVDGDTLKVRDKAGDLYTVRLIGIDTPETVHPRRQSECFGLEASLKLKELAEGAYVEMEKDVSETDRYGRLLRYIYKDGVLINEVMVREGYAFSARFPPDVNYAELFDDAQRDAYENKRGLWNESVCSYSYM